MGADGNIDVFFHVQLRPSHDSQGRYLAVGQLQFDTTVSVLIRGTSAAGSDPAAANQPALRSVPVPQIDNGFVQRVLSLPAALS